jgi:hypothetical protein
MSQSFQIIWQDIPQTNKETKRNPTLHNIKKPTKACQGFSQKVEF